MNCCFDGTLSFNTSNKPLLNVTLTASALPDTKIFVNVEEQFAQYRATSWVWPPMRMTGGAPSRSSMFWSSWRDNVFGEPTSPR